ncbi:MAG TPA: glucose-6-phosphate dehydrogenase, partial [Gammaproteobacteria bacterium]|nr:glucose-6-phosphate dehydrogenase [Gammaproteobacteria bacterium]
VLHESFAEPQIYRIDHYLGKETVQNILMYRLANSTVEPIWNRRYIDHVQITVAETVGVENRAGYYDQAGALRDMLPNHLLALMSVVAMEPANALNGEAIRNEQAKILSIIQPLEPEEVLTQAVRGQYGAGELADGSMAPAYRDEPGVADGSATETYVALKLMIDSWRWAGVPFYLRTGKRMAGRYTEIAIQFKHAPNMMFKDSLVKRANIPPNVLILRIQPNEGIGMCFNTKVPSPIPQLSPVEMDFTYADYFGQAPTTGYETLIYDCLSGDPTLFKRADIIESGWSLVEPILDVWSALPPRSFPNYAAGSWGPDEADALLHNDGRSWRKCAHVKKQQ